MKFLSLRCPPTIVSIAVFFCTSAYRTRRSRASMKKSSKVSRRRFANAKKSRRSTRNSIRRSSLNFLTSERVRRAVRWSADECFFDSRRWIECRFEELPAELFLQTCENVFLSLVSKFNNPIFSPMKSDVYGNISVSLSSIFFSMSSLKKLRRKIDEDPNRFRTLFSMINDEIKGQSAQKKNSATDALLWLKR